MNWKFWQKKVPAPPVLKMPDSEQAVIDHFLKNERLWSIRRWKVKDRPAIRADFQDVLIVSIPAAADCGPYAFSYPFAKEWHEMLNDRLNGRELVEEERAYNATVGLLEQRFGTTKK